MDIGRRVERAVSPSSGDAGDPRLLEVLHTEIERSGPLSFARFMELALYHPDLGYYATSAARPTRVGDFLTAPELHAIFGRTLARQLHEMWQRLDEPRPFTIVEYGAGRGSLILAVADGLAEIGSGLLDHLRYSPRDLPAQLSEIRRRLDAAGLGRLLDAPADGPLVGCVLANEFIDALPVHRLVAEAGELREIYVDWGEDGPAEVTGELSQPALGAWLDEAGVVLADGQRAEANLAMLEWLAEVAHELGRGYVLIVDYAAEPAELYSPRRRGGTLRAFRGQHVSSDVLRGIGHQDLTAHVDLAALARGARRAGLEVLGRTTQAEFLMGAGLEAALAEESRRTADDWQARLLLRSAIGRLLDPRALGGYAVVLLARNVPVEPPLSALAYRMPSRDGGG